MIRGLPLGIINSGFELCTGHHLQWTSSAVDDMATRRRRAAAASISTDQLCNKCTTSNSNEDWICCDTCDRWFHNSCSGIPVDIIPKISKVKFILFSCQLCLDGKNTSPPEPKMDIEKTVKECLQSIIPQVVEETISAIHTNINGLSTKFDTLIEPLTAKPKLSYSNVIGTMSADSSSSTVSSSAIASNTPSSSFHTNHTTSCEIIIDNLPEDKNEFKSLFESDAFKVDAILNHLDPNTKSNVTQVRRIGKSIPSRTRPRPLCIQFRNEYDAKKCLMKSYTLHSFNKELFISPSLTPEQLSLKRKLLKFRHEYATEHKLKKSDIKLKGLKLYLNNRELSVSEKTSTSENS